MRTEGDRPERHALWAWAFNDCVMGTAPGVNDWRRAAAVATRLIEEVHDRTEPDEPNTTVQEPRQTSRRISPEAFDDGGGMARASASSDAFP